MEVVLDHGHATPEADDVVVTGDKVEALVVNLAGKSKQGRCGNIFFLLGLRQYSCKKSFQLYPKDDRLYNSLTYPGGSLILFF